jgi:DNA polymerase III subunit delta
MNKIKEDIRKHQFKPVYLLYGTEEYLKKLYKDKLKTAIIGEDNGMNYTYFEGKNIDVSKVIAQAETLPFFNDRRLIIIEDSGLFKSKSDFADFLSAMPDTTHIIFIEKEIDKRNRLYKKVKELGTISEMNGLSEKDLKVWILTLLKKDKKKITQSTLSYLLNKTGPDMDYIQNEVEKLICYTLNHDVITTEDIDAVCTEQITGKIFQMIDAIASKDNDMALDLYYDLLSLKEKPMSILFLLARHFTILIQVKNLMSFGYTNSVVSQKSGIRPYFLGKYKEQTRKISIESLKAALDLCTKTEEEIKTGKQMDQLGVELLIIQCTNTK